jgi:transposase-like protein
VTKPEQLEGVFRTLKKALVERVLGAELTSHLGYAPGEEKPEGQVNHRNGTTPKTVITDDGVLPLDVPRDRAGTFEPQFVPKNIRRLPGFDQKVLSLYARGMTVREIRSHLEEMYQVHVAPDVISTVTDAVLEEVAAWQQRPLERMYPVVIFDALRVKIRDEGVVRNKAVYLAIGVTRDGTRDVLGLWIERSESATFWLRVLTELQSRGVEDILVALVDGLTGVPDALATAFPHTQVHQCTVHLVRQSLTYVHWQERRAVAAELRTIYTAPTAAAAQAAMDAFAASPTGDRYPTVAAVWQRHWERLEPVFQYPPAIRRLLYTTNAIESLHMQLRKVIKNRGHFPSDAAAAK